MFILPRVIGCEVRLQEERNGSSTGISASYRAPITNPWVGREGMPVDDDGVGKKDVTGSRGTLI